MDQPEPEPPPAAGLAPAGRRALRARAHALPVRVLIGDKGLTEAVIAEIDRALAAHELVKVRATADRDTRPRLLARLCEQLGAQPVQVIGRVLVLYREKPARPAAAPPPSVRGKTVKRSGRRGSRSASRRPAPAPRRHRRPPSR